MNIDPNAPAYPVFYTHNSSGLTNRQELIFRIAAGLASNPGVATTSGTPSDEHIAGWAIALADAVLAEMNRSNL